MSYQSARRVCGAPNNIASKMNPNLITVPEMGSADPDELFVCPYDPIHRVAAKRFPYHLMKCRKNWVGKAMSTCPFNARHIVPQPEFRHHVANCPDKACIEQDMAFFQRQDNNDGCYTKGNTSVPAYNRNLPSPTEDWEREISAEPVMGYNPDNQHHHKPVFRNLTGYTPAEKRDFHKDSGKFHFKNQEDVDTHAPVVHKPSPQRPNASTAPPHAHSQSTPSSSTTTASHSHHQMRLPKQPPKAAVVAAAAHALPQPGRGESAMSKRGGRIAANIFGSGLTRTQHAVNMSSSAAAKPVSTPLANGESHSSTGGSTPNGNLSNGYSKPTSPPSAFRPPVGLGRGLAPPPGLGRGIVPGIGRGLASYTGSLSFEPKVGIHQQ